MNTYLRTRRPTLCQSVVAFLSSLLIISALLQPAASAETPPLKSADLEHGFVAALNAQRSNKGLAPLRVSHSMTKAADGWALAMAEGSFLAHSDNAVAGVPPGWTKVGENVGRGKNVASLTAAFMDSSGHRANILDSAYTHIGVAVYRHPSDGRVYTVHRFAALNDTRPAPVVQPVPASSAGSTAAAAMPGPIRGEQPASTFVAPERAVAKSKAPWPHKTGNRQRTSLYR